MLNWDLKRGHVNLVGAYGPSRVTRSDKVLLAALMTVFIKTEIVM
jgi:hypothetical protein